MPSSHTPHQPSRDAFEGEDLAAYDAVVTRQRAYDYTTFAKMFPQQHSKVVAATLLEAAGDEAGEHPPDQQGPDDETSSVAGDAHQVAGVVHELVDVHVVAEHRGGALVDAHEVIEEQAEERGAGEIIEDDGEGFQKIVAFLEGLKVI